MPAKLRPFKPSNSRNYWFRKTVPVDVRQFADGKREWKESLHTEDYRVAERKVAVLDAQYSEWINMARRGEFPAMQDNRPTLHDIAVLAHRWLRGEVDKLKGFKSQKDFSPYVLESTITIKGERVEILEAFNDPIIEAIERGFAAQKQISGHIAYRLLRDNGLSLVEDSELYQQLVRSLCFRHIELNQIAADICCGRVWSLPFERDLSGELLSVEEARSKATVKKGLGRVTFKSIGNLAAEFVEYEAKRREWTAKYRSNVENALNLFMEFVGKEANPARVASSDIRDYLDLSERLPKNFRQYRQLRGLPLSQIAEAGEKEGLEATAADTQRHRWQHVHALFEYATKMVSDMEGARNPADGLKPSARKGERAQRVPFSMSDLKAIMKATRLAGKPSMLWAPRISLATGMRSDEVLQLQREDVKELDGIWYVDVNTDVNVETGMRKHLKNSNSNRAVPIPAILIEAGFLDFAQQSGEGRLFPELKPDRYGKYSSNYGRQFGELLKEFGIKPAADSKKLKDFHSFRHTFKALARQYEVDTECADLIGGWQESTAKHSKVALDYGRSEYWTFLGRLQREINKINYEGLEF